MSWFGRKKAPELERVAAARASIERHGTVRPVVRHTLDKVEAAIETALDDRTRVAESLADFDSDRIDAELKAALRARPDPTAPDDATIASLRRRHEAVHELRNRVEEIDASITKALVDLDTLVAHHSLAGSSDDGTLEDLRHWLDLLDNDARDLTMHHTHLDPRRTDP